MSDPSKFLPLSVSALHILLALADSDKHGYAIMKEVATMSDGAVTMGPGTLYTSIKRLLEDGLIVESGESDGRRRCYGLSSLGQAVARAEVKRLSTLIARSAFSRLAPRVN